MTFSCSLRCNIWWFYVDCVQCRTFFIVQHGKKCKFHHSFCFPFFLLIIMNITLWILSDFLPHLFRNDIVIDKISFSLSLLIFDGKEKILWKNNFHHRKKIKSAYNKIKYFLVAFWNFLSCMRNKKAPTTAIKMKEKQHFLHLKF